MPLYKLLLSFLGEHRFRLFPGGIYRIVPDSEKSLDSESEDGCTSPLQNEPLLSGGENQTRIQTESNSNRLEKWPLLIAALLFTVSLVFEIAMRMKIDSACLTLNEPWSPLTHLVEYEWRQFDSDNCPTEYCGMPSKEREDAWKRLWDLGWMAFPRGSLSTLNKSADDSWLHPVHPLDENALVAMPEFNHQMHCISLIREAIYKDQFDFTGYINTSRIEFNLHLNHCLLALKIVIECKADSAPILLEEREVQYDTWGKDAQLSAWKLRDPPKQCRNFEPLHDWYDANTICSSFCGAPEIYNGKQEKHEHRDIRDA